MWSRWKVVTRKIQCHVQVCEIHELPCNDMYTHEFTPKINFNSSSHSKRRKMALGHSTCIKFVHGCVTAAKNLDFCPNIRIFSMEVI